MPLALMRMLIDRESGITPSSADRAYMSGMDQIPWPCRTRLADGELQIERGVTESGRLQVPMRIEGRGELLLSTGTLMARDRSPGGSVQLGYTRHPTRVVPRAQRPRRQRAIAAARLIGPARLAGDV